MGKHKNKHKKRSILKRYKKEIPFILVALSVVAYILHEIAFFIIASITLIYISILTIKKINKINLRSDLNCWGVRLLGVVFIIVGMLLLGFIYFKGLFLMSFSYDIKITLGLCLIFIGGFCGYRSTRRFPMVGIWQ